MLVGVSIAGETERQGRGTASPSRREGRKETAGRRRQSGEESSLRGTEGKLAVLHDQEFAGAFMSAVETFKMRYA